jgi:hypothetical protein
MRTGKCSILITKSSLRIRINETWTVTVGPERNDVPESTMAEQPPAHNPENLKHWFRDDLPIYLGIRLEQSFSNNQM